MRLRNCADVSAHRAFLLFEGWLSLRFVIHLLIFSAISLFLLASRISARLRDFAERAARFKPLQVTLYVVPYLLLMYVLSFPLNLYEHFYREHQYGLATQSFAPWFGEQLVALSLTLIIGTILLIVLYAVFRRAPRTWWIWGAIVAVIFSCAATFIAPVYIEPLFNTYKPLN